MARPRRFERLTAWFVARINDSNLCLYFNALTINSVPCRRFVKFSMHLILLVFIFLNGTD